MIGSAGETPVADQGRSAERFGKRDIDGVSEPC
jgi:hypothetical protein